LTQLILARHGQTYGNVERRWQGWSDTSLNEVGQQQALRLAERLRPAKGQIDALYSSPLIRAYQTARPIALALDLPIRLVDGLKEFHFGLIEGLTTPEFETRFPEAFDKWVNSTDFEFTYPGGESRAGFFRRVSDTIEAIADRHPGETVLVITHGGTLRGILAHFLPDDTEKWLTFSANNGSLTYLNVNGHGPQLITLDDRDHLAGIDKVEI